MVVVNACVPCMCTMRPHTAAVTVLACTVLCTLYVVSGWRNSGLAVGLHFYLASMRPASYFQSLMLKQKYVGCIQPHDHCMRQVCTAVCEEQCMKFCGTPTDNSLGSGTMLKVMTMAPVPSRRTSSANRTALSCKLACIAVMCTP